VETKQKVLLAAIKPIITSPLKFRFAMLGLSGIGKTVIEPVVVISIVAIRYFVLPACGIGVVTAATKLGFLPRSPLYRYVLLLQSTVPPAMSIGNANSASVVSIRDALYLRADVPPLR